MLKMLIVVNWMRSGWQMSFYEGCQIKECETLGVWIHWKIKCTLGNIILAQCGHSTWKNRERR